MKIGIISDTHGLLRPEVFSVFKGVEHIVHAGDLGDPDILIELRAIAPVTAVWGNTDDLSIRAMLPERVRMELAGVTIGVLHGHQLGSPNPQRVAAEMPDAGLVIFGHTHEPAIERVGSVVAMNPGSAGRARFRQPITVALADLGEEPHVRIVELVRRADG